MPGPLRIVVAVKHGIDVALTRPDPSTGAISLANAQRKTSDFDRNAVEEAVRIRERSGATVTAVSVGGAAAREAVRDALAIGADEGVLIAVPDAGATDSRLTARAVSAFLRGTGFDLLLLGEGSTDHFSGTVGPRVAAELSIPSVCHVRRLALEPGAVVADRDLESAVESVRVGLPAVVTVGQEINTPRAPTFLSTLKASKKEIRQVPLTELPGLLPTPAPAVRIERAFQPTVPRKQRVLSGASPDALATELLEALRSEGLPLP